MYHHCAHSRPSTSGFRRVVIELDLSRVVTFDQTSAFTVPDIDRWNDFHRIARAIRESGTFSFRRRDMHFGLGMVYESGIDVNAGTSALFGVELRANDVVTDDGSTHRSAVVRLRGDDGGRIWNTVV